MLYHFLKYVVCETTLRYFCNIPILFISDLPEFSNGQLLLDLNSQLERMSCTCVVRFFISRIGQQIAGKYIA